MKYPLEILSLIAFLLGAPVYAQVSSEKLPHVQRAPVRAKTDLPVRTPPSVHPAK